MSRWWIVALLRTALALLDFSALVTEVATLVARHRYNAGDFFSYFTVEANALAITSLLLSSFAMAAGWRSRRLDFFRGAVAFYMTTVILIFIVLLSGYPSADLTAVPWDNTVLHYIMPVVLILDWIAFRAPAPFGPRIALTWLVFPFAYLAYSLVRGPIAHWYPYPFMNPSVHGYLGVAITSVVIAVILAVLACIAGSVSNWPAVRARSGLQERRRR